MKCAVLNCGNENKSKASECSFFRFPKDKALVKKWTSFCRRPDTFNPKTSHICMVHFIPDDFENIMQYDMGFTNVRLLKRGAVPTIYNPLAGNVPLYEEREKRIERRKNKKLVESLLKEYDKTVAPPPPIFEEPSAIENDEDAEADYVELMIEAKPIEKEDSVSTNGEKSPLDTNHDNDNIIEWDMENIENELDNLQQENQQLRAAHRQILLRQKLAEKTHLKRLAAEKRRHCHTEEMYLDEIHNLTERLERAEDEIKYMDNKLATIFTRSQIKKLKSDGKRKIWTKEDIVQSITLYATSAKAYELLHQRGFPLPSVRILQQWAQKRNMSKRLFQSEIE